MEEGAEDSLADRVCGVKERDWEICVTFDLTFNMPPNRNPTCIQLLDMNLFLRDRGAGAPAVSRRDESKSLTIALRGRGTIKIER